MSFCEFYKSVLPGNYALTKSMELRKESYSGTLWYTKKFLVLYYYIFLDDDIYTQTFIEKIKKAFDLYIQSLDPLVQQEATKFFYPDNPSVNFNSEKFIRFPEFAAAPDDRNSSTRSAYYMRAKKLYFALLMGSGGQSGVKKRVKELISEQGFIYSKIAIEKAIMKAVIEVCVEQLNRNGHISDNSIKEIISKSCMEKLVGLSDRCVLSEDIVERTINEYSNNPKNYMNIENDLPAFIRNERQVLYYFGYFHSKTSGAKDIEFSSLTPIGELALEANSNEFLAIWEHQKLKMISQPITVQINKVNCCQNSAEGFGISFTPYTDVIGHIMRNQELVTEQYKYIVSRRKHIWPEERWIVEESEILSRINDVKHLIHSFNRTRDVQAEDSNKELTKYVLGIQGDLRLDNGTHPFSFIKKHGNSKYVAIDAEKMKMLYRIYMNLENYKILKYRNLFESCEKNLREKYIADINRSFYSIDSKTKISWDLYNISVNEVVLMGAILAIAAYKSGVDLFASNIDSVLDRVFIVIKENFDELFKKMGYTSDAKKRNVIKKVILTLKDDNWTRLDKVDTKDDYDLVDTYREISSSDLFSKLKEASTVKSINIDGVRMRNTNLVKLLKSYYIHRFTDNNTLKCECCTNDSFVANNNEPYVEFHHLIPFSLANGPDHYLNLFALCPNCHRKIHFMKINEKRDLYNELNNNNYFQKGFVERLLELKRNLVLKSYHLEYLLAEEAITEEEYLEVAG